ncbi:MAG TPA: hypothetical protein VKZ18_11150 [Polyangia bacterium]|nr:hypothetical protein [Polyangia bacterium]
MRIFAALACLLALSSVARAQEAPAASAPPPLPAQQAYDAQRKSTALAVTLEALSPVAGVGAFYARDADAGLALAITSAVAAGAGVGAVFWLIHLDHQQESGVNRAFQDLEQGAAISLLATAAVVYVLSRVSGLVLAPQATHRFNADLRQGLGLPPPEPVVPFHALAPGPTLTLRF